MDTRLSGRVALVTGANHGIGAATAEGLASEGAPVLITYLRLDDEWSHHAQDATDVLARIRAAGGRAEAVEADLADPRVPARLFDEAERIFGPVEILVNNADHCVPDTFASGQRDPIGRDPEPVTAETVDAHFAVNGRATALLIAEFARRHVGRGATWGRIVSVTTNALHGFPSEVSYGSSKLALEGYTLSAAGELGTHGVTANVVCPGPTQTGWIPAELEQPWAEQHQLGRLGGPDDVAGVILLLCSEAGGWITRQRVYADGGFRR